MNEENINIFEYAAKHKIRFSHKGSISVEDLYSLTEKELDILYKALKKQSEVDFEDGLLETSKSIPLEARVKLALVKAVFADKQATKDARKKAVEKAAKIARFDELIAQAEEKKLQGLSVEELRKLRDELEAQ